MGQKRARWAEWHWHSFMAPGLPVSFPALRMKHFRWRGIYGVQIGPWFIGAVKGQPGEPWEPPAPGIEAAPADMTRSGMAEGESPSAESGAPLTKPIPSPQEG